MIGPLLGALVSGAGIFADAGAKKDANNINWASLFETKRANRATEGLQRSSRRDAYGNLLKYTKGIGWEIDTTPMTKAIMDSQQKEELANLTQDAPRNRAAAERMDTRSKMGSEEFTKQFNEYKYRPRTSEAADIADSTNTLLSGRRKGLDEASAMLARQLMRTGGSSELASVYKNADDTYAKTLSDAMLEGKRLGRATNQQRQMDDLQGMGGELSFLKGISDQTTTTPVGNPGGQYNSDMTGRADQALQQLVGAMQSSRGASQQAYSTLAHGVANSAPDFSGLASSLSRLSFGSNSPTADSQLDTQSKQLRNQLLMQKLGIPQQEDSTQPSSGYDPWAGMR